MKKILTVLTLICFLFLTISSISEAATRKTPTRVKGYSTKKGKYIKSHYAHTNKKYKNKR